MDKDEDMNAIILLWKMPRSINLLLCKKKRSKVEATILCTFHLIHQSWTYWTTLVSYEAKIEEKKALEKETVVERVSEAYSRVHTSGLQGIVGHSKCQIIKYYNKEHFIYCNYFVFEQRSI